MSEMPLGPETGIDRLQVALVGFTGCIGEAVEDICSYGLTIGDSYVPFDPDPEDEDAVACEDDGAACSQVWVRVVNVNPTGDGMSFSGQDCTSEMQITLEVGVIRCIEVPEGGEAPTASDVLVAALQAMTDMNAIFCAAMNCEVWDQIDAGQWLPQGPLGGQYGGQWTFTVTL